MHFDADLRMVILYKGVVGSSGKSSGIVVHYEGNPLIDIKGATLYNLRFAHIYNSTTPAWASELSEEYQRSVCLIKCDLTSKSLGA